MCLIALNPGFPFWVLSRRFDVSPNCETKSGTENLGSRLVSELNFWSGSCQKDHWYVFLSFAYTQLSVWNISWQLWEKKGRIGKFYPIDHQVSLPRSLTQGLLSSVHCLVLLQGVKEKTKSLWSYINSQVERSQYFVCSQAPSGCISSVAVYLPAVGSRAHNDIKMTISSTFG